MKTYSNHKFIIVEDDNSIVSTNNKTDNFCVLLAFVALFVLIAGIIFATTAAKAEAMAYSAQANQELCNLMEFNGSTYKCEE